MGAVAPFHGLEKMPENPKELLDAVVQLNNAIIDIQMVCLTLDQRIKDLEKPTEPAMVPS